MVALRARNGSDEPAPDTGMLELAPYVRGRQLGIGS